MTVTDQVMPVAVAVGGEVDHVSESSIELVTHGIAQLWGTDVMLFVPGRDGTGSAKESGSPGFPIEQVGAAFKEKYPRSTLRFIDPLRPETSLPAMAEGCHGFVWIGNGTAFGGQPEIVARRLEGRFSGLADAIELAPKGGLPVIVASMRGSETDFRELWPGEDSLLSFARRRMTRIVEETCSFCAAAAKARQDQGEALITAGRYLAPQEADEPQLAREIRQLYAEADTLAGTYRKKVRNAFVAIYGLGMLAALSFSASIFAKGQLDAFAAWWGIPPFSIYWVTLALAYTVYMVARRTRIAERFADYRALAEALRIQYFWLACGVENSVCREYLRQQNSELDWIRLAIASAMLRFRSGLDAPPAVSEERRTKMLEFWLSDQAAYLTRAQARARTFTARARKAVIVSFLIGVSASTSIMFVPNLEQLVGAGGRSLLGIVMIFCPALSAAIMGYTSKMGFRFQTSLYDRMGALYRRAAYFVESTPNHRHGEVAHELGHQSLIALGEWLVQTRAQTIDEPANPFRKPW